MPGTQRVAGFTLIELSVALAIGALLLTLAMPGLARFYARLQFDTKMAELSSGLAALPRLAYALGEEGTLADLAAQHLDIPPDWSLHGADGIYIRSNGLCAGGRLRVETPGGEREFELVPPFCETARTP